MSATPRPWTIDDVPIDPSLFRGFDPMLIIRSADERWVALVCVDGIGDTVRTTAEEQRENAEFIFAAVNSHEALIGALEAAQAAMWDSYYGNGIDLGYVQTVDRQIRAALAQAGVK